MLREGETDPKTARPETPVYDNEEVMHLLRRLPLAVGYKASIPVLTTLGGGAVLPIGVEVTKKVTVETPAGKFDCFEVLLSVAQTFWISDDEHRYLVKFDAGGALANLTSISQKKAGTPIPFRDEKLGVSFTTPGEWVIHARADNNGKETDIFLLDPAADADQINLELTNSDTLPAAARQSARALADHQIQKLTKNLKDFKVRANSWKNYNVSGRPGVGLVGDYTENGKPKVVFSLSAVGPRTSENLILTCAPDKLEGLQKAVEGIIATYRTTK
jgi:hypothetical protein